MNIISSHPAEVYVETELNQWLTREQLVELQLRRVNALLQHAVERVPFHRRRLATHTGRAPELRSLADLAQLPVLTKTDIQANLDVMVPAGANRAEWIKNATGGSTGEPLMFYRDQRAQLWVEAAKERFRRWMGCVNEDKLALIWGADRDFPPQIPPNEKWLNVFNCREADIERFILELVQWKPRTIRGYAGSLHLVAQFIKQRGLPPVRPHAIEAAAETLTPEMRRDIEAAFGAPVFNFYGAREMSCIACEDHRRDGLLVADDIRLAEVVRDGRAAAPGEEGKLILTDLVNYAMPFIRYEIGDMAIAAAENPAGTECAFSRVQQVLGRTANTITAPDGRLVHGEFFTHLFYHKPGISNFQVRQSAQGDINVSIVPDDSFQPATVEKIVGIMREHLGADVHVSWRTVADIPATKTGKRMFTVSEIPVSFGRNGNGHRANGQTVQPSHEKFSPPARQGSSSTKPRILFLADRPGWAFDINAHGVAEALRDEFEFRIEYVVQQPDLNAWPHDLLVVMFWGEDYHRRFNPDPRRIIKQVSSHRWALEEQFGKLNAEQMARRYLADAGTVIVPSQKLHKLIAPFRDTFLAPKGCAAEAFQPVRRSGPIRFGWVGNPKDACKGLNDILLPATGRDFELVVAGGELAPQQMAGFYNSVDVLCVASTAEGDPRPLIEGMASGCFPVAVDVGIVPELVAHGRSGFIVERRVAAFRASFQWCRCNTEFVREAGLRNSARVRESRSWASVAPQWRKAFHAALVKCGSTKEENPPALVESLFEERKAELATIFQAGYSRAEWDAAQPALESVFRTATGSPHAPAGYNDAVTYALRALRREHNVVVDVGAWLGDFAMNAAVLNPEASVFALEPEPRNFAFLARRAPANVFPFRLAVSGRCGRSDIFISDNSQGHTLYRELVNPSHAKQRPVAVPTVTFAQLVEMAGGRIDFMKINAEGAEFDILPTPAFRSVEEAIVEIHLEGTEGRRLLDAVGETHSVEVIEDRSPRFLFVHLRRKPTH
ncbi:MAG: FkbM family methyltransferase [Verrucomicrobia bacterium]|nr:FkbM family methyltransferase [Verrucomicrobiota bacterium]